MIRKYINVIVSDKELPNITILDAIIILQKSWSTLPDITPLIALEKRGFQDSQQSSTQDTDDPFAQLAEILDELRVLEQELIPDGLTSETLTAREEEVATSTQHVLCDEKLMHYTTNENVEIID